MGWDSGHDKSWSQLERAMRGGRIVDPLVPVEFDGGDGPGFSRRREPYAGEKVERGVSQVPYAELHCHSNYSFLDGASHPAELVEEASRQGLEALALTDHDGFYGVVKFAEAAGEQGLKTIFGAELSLSPLERSGMGDPGGDHLLILARNEHGYARLSHRISEAHIEGNGKGQPVYRWEEMYKDLRDKVVVLTGCRKGTVRRALEAEGRSGAARELDKLVEAFGGANVAVELTDHGHPLDYERNEVLYELARDRRLRAVATNNVHYHVPTRRRLATVMAAVRGRTSLDGINPYLPAASSAYLRSGDEMARIFADFPGVVEAAAELGREIAFDLQLVAPNLPPYPVSFGHTETTFLRKLVLDGAEKRYGPPEAHPEAYARIEHELALILKLKFQGYFLIVWDIVNFCRENGIYCQGRGSAANSAVCYALWITNVDPVRNTGLVFERFLAEERGEPPDIDVDIESDRREEVIQYVFDKHGRYKTAQVANVISYRPRSAVRDVARAFGFPVGQQDAWSKQIDRWSSLSTKDVDGVPEHVVHFASALLEAPRHLGIHSGGMVICDRPVTEVCPVEQARMEKRTVLQWDKDDCAAVNLVKFDLLGLGMLSALRYGFEFIGEKLDVADMPLDDPEIYAMLCRADSVGVFQVESRAQISTLPRLRPEKFYDLVVEVALIRPGPIQGGSVHPFIRRKNKEEEVAYGHDLMKNSLDRTLGVPLFQEQMMQLAIDVASFTPTEADQLRRAMGSKRSLDKMAQLKDRLYAGMARNGIPGDVADDIYTKLAAFANYGFPESHAISFAYLVYASSWLKRYHPAPFLAALLNAQPMGFYSPQSLTDDARRHGVEVRRPDINASKVKSTLEGPVRQSLPGEPPSRWGIGGPAVRLGLDSVKALGDEAAQRIVERRADGPYRDMADLARRVGLSTAQMEALATADAFAGFGLDRRAALWGAGAAATETADRLPGTASGVQAPVLPGMEAVDELVADVWAMGMSPDSHPIKLVRSTLDAERAWPISRLGEVLDGTQLLVGGLITHRQRPATAGGVIFLNLEDETGMLNVVCFRDVFTRQRKLIQLSPALRIWGRLENATGAVNLIAERVAPLVISTRPASRDWR